MAQTLKIDKDIPLTMGGGTALSAIGQKSANVIVRDSGIKAQGIIVDLLIVCVAQRLSIATTADPEKTEAQLMEALSETKRGEIGMAISFLSRKICRPTNPKHGY